MKRAARAVLGFLVGVVIAWVWLVPARAETIAATAYSLAPTARYKFVATWYSSYQAAQAAALAYYAGAGATGYTNGAWSSTPPAESGFWSGWTSGAVGYFTVGNNAPPYVSFQYTLTKEWVCASGSLSWTGSAYTCQGGTGYSCPSGQNWTLSGSQCTRPDCTSGQVRDPANGLCIQACTVAENDEVGYVEAQSLPSGTKGCLKGCQVYQGGTVYTDSSGKRVTGAYSYGTPCTGTVAPLADQPTTSCYKQGMCSGTVNNAVVCVPCNKTESTSTSKTTTPAAGGNPETIKTTTKVETCTGAGSCTTTTSTSTSTGGGAPVAGSTTTSTTPDGKASGAARADGQGGYDLDLPDDYAREGTTKQIQESTKKIADVLDLAGGADSSAIDNADAEAATKQARDDKDKEVMDRIDGTVDVAASQKSAWQSAMSSGFLGPITMTGCSPYSVTIAGRTWTLDHCPIAAKIAEIMSYALWFGLAIGGFVFLTGGRAAGVK